MPDAVLQDTLKVKTKDIEYEFRIPSLADEIKLSMHERRIRRELDPDGNGSPDGLDQNAFLLVRSAAIFEVLLASCTHQWPYSKGEKGEPVVDFRKWPKDKVTEAAAAGMLFLSELDRFRGGGAANGQPDGAQAVAGQPDP